MVFVFVIAGITLGKAAQPASAMNPVRTTPDAVVNTVWEDLNYHWDWYMRYYGHSYYRPRLVYYNYSANGYTYDFQTSCGSTAESHGTMGFYCPSDSSLALDWTDLWGAMTRFGDGAVAFWLAHEFAHHAQTVSRADDAGPPSYELEADCMAGAFFNYEVVARRYLDHWDAVEAWYQLNALGNDPTHGTGQQRAAAFAFGYNNGTWRACDVAF